VLVELMGGALTLDDNPGGGSIFAFTIPCLESAAAEPAQGTEIRPVALNGARALIIANSPFEAPAIAARLTEAGAKVARADGLQSGLAALQQPMRPDLVIVDRALGREATNCLAKAAREAGAPRSLVLFSPFERRALGQNEFQSFDGWLVQPVRVRSLFERLAAEFSFRLAEPASQYPSHGRGRAGHSLLRTKTSMRSLRRRALRRLGFDVVRAAKKRCGSPRLRPEHRLRSTSSRWISECRGLTAMRRPVACGRSKPLPARRRRR
jgi:hypothetical protein